MTPNSSVSTTRPASSAPPRPRTAPAATSRAPGAGPARGRGRRRRRWRGGCRTRASAAAPRRPRRRRCRVAASSSAMPAKAHSIASSRRSSLRLSAADLVERPHLEDRRGRIDGAHLAAHRGDDLRRRQLALHDQPHRPVGEAMERPVERRQRVGGQPAVAHVTDDADDAQQPVVAAGIDLAADGVVVAEERRGQRRRTARCCAAPRRASARRRSGRAAAGSASSSK